VNEIKEPLRKFILSEYLPGEKPEHLRDNTPLQTSSLLDSLGVVRLISFIEKTFRVKLDARDTAIERFDCIEDIATTIARKQ
jgi:acyl carrier protein